MDSYLDYSGRRRRSGGGVRMVPVNTPSAPSGCGPNGRATTRPQGPAAPRRPRGDPRVPRGVRQLPPGRRGRVLLLRPAGLRLQRPARRARRCGSSTASSTKSSRCAGRWASDRDNFVLYGHSWGGILAIEYALRHQEHLRGLVISNMMASVPAYNAYAEQVLMPEMDQARWPRSRRWRPAGETENPRYMELLDDAPLRAPRAAHACSTTGPTPCSAASPTSTRPSTSRCRDRASSGSAPTPSWPTGTAAPTWPRSRSHAGHRRPLRHDGPGPHGDDGRPPAARPLPVLPRWQPPGHVRRPGHLLRGLTSFLSMIAAP